MFIILGIFAVIVLFAILKFAFSIFIDLMWYVGPAVMAYVGWQMIKSTNHATLGIWMVVIGMVIFFGKVFN